MNTPTPNPAEPDSLPRAGCVERLVRVILDNPGGYNNYQGTVKRVFSVGNQEWADIEWDMPIHPCTTPMETRHLIPANAKILPTCATGGSTGEIKS
jgi:hypothetical protein